MTSIVTKRFCDAVVRISSYDRHGVPIITGCNSTAEAVTGYSADELQTMRLPDLISGITAELLREEFISNTGVNDLVDIFKRYPQASVRRKDGSEAPAELKAFIIPGEGTSHDGAPLCGVYEIIIRDKSLSSRLSDCVRTHEGGGNRNARCRVTGLPSGEFAGACLNTYAAYAHEHGDAPFSFAVASVGFREHHIPDSRDYNKEDRINLNAIVSRGIRSGLRADDVIISMNRKFLHANGLPDMYLPAKGAFFFGLGLPYCDLFQAHKSLERLRAGLMRLPGVEAVARTAGIEPDIHIGCVSMNTAINETAISAVHRAVEILYAARSFGEGRTAISARHEDVSAFLGHETPQATNATPLAARIH